MNQRTINERLHEIVAPRCDDLSVELVDIDYAGGVVRVTIDRPGGVDLDTVARVTREVSRALDESDPITGRYTLEVTSPGLERPLRTPAHFARSIGATVRLKLRAGVAADRRLEGVLVAADEQGITLAPAGAAGEHRVAAGEHRVAYGDIERARTVFEWGPAPKPGSTRSDKKAVHA